MILDGYPLNDTLFIKLLKHILTAAYFLSMIKQAIQYHWLLDSSVQILHGGTSYEDTTQFGGYVLEMVQIVLLLKGFKLIHVRTYM